MKFALYLTFIICLLLPFFSCKDSNTVEKKEIQTEKATKKKNTPTDYDKVQTDLGLTNNQIIRIRRIEKHYKDTVKSLVKQKKWMGPKNGKTRRTTNIKKTNDLKKVLKDKFNSYINMVK